MKPLRGKRLGSAQSARGIQPGGDVVPVGRASNLPRGRPPAVPGSRPPSGAFPPRRCAATGLGSAWKGQGAKVARGLRPASFTAPSRPDFAAYPGAAVSTSAPSLPRGRGTGPLRPLRVPSTGPDCPQSASDRVAQPRAGTGLRTKGRSGSAAMPATQPTRLETRTKESNACASQRADRNPTAQ